MAVVSRVLLDQVGEDPAERHFPAVAQPLADGVQRQTGRRAAGGLDLGAPGGEVGRDVGGVDVVEVAVRLGLGPVVAGGDLLAEQDGLDQYRSTSAMCRTRPSSERPDGGTERSRSWSSVSPPRLSARVLRW